MQWWSTDLDGDSKLEFMFVDFNLKKIQYWKYSGKLLACLTLPLAIVAICYKNVEWLQVQVIGLKYSLCGSKMIYLLNSVFWSAFEFLNTAFIILSHFINVPYFSLWELDFFNTILVSNSLYLDQARHFVRPDLGPNCLEWLSADNKSRP